MRVALSTRQLWRKLSNGKSLFLIAGPCVIESEELCLKVARSLRKTCERLGVTYIFKASFDKANRTSGRSRRGPGLEQGLQILKTVRKKVNVPILTDIHDEEQARAAAEVVDAIQIPAFLCRQTDLIESAARTSAIVNLKKGQFLSPQEMGQVVKKTEAAGGKMLFVTDRGRPSATTIWCLTCVPCRSCGSLAGRWFSMPLIRCRCPVVAAISPAGMESMRPCWHAPQWRLGRMVFSLKRIPIPPRPGVTGQTWCAKANA